MFSYIKSLLAVGLALLAVASAGLWVQNRSRVYQALINNYDNLRLQAASAQAYAPMIADYQRRLAMLDRDLKTLTAKFIGRDYESPQLVKAVVKAASTAGLEMTNAAKQDRKTDSAPVRGLGRKAVVITHEITLKGPYPGLVKFMQSLAAWDLGYRLESIEITPTPEGAAAGDIEVTIVLSVFALETVSET